jgi:hypothetical protein
MKLSAPKVSFRFPTEENPKVGDSAPSGDVECVGKSPLDVISPESKGTFWCLHSILNENIFCTLKASISESFVELNTYKLDNGSLVVSAKL